MWWFLLLIPLFAALLYYELVLAEGAHLGARVVVWLYDLVAPRYDSIKKFKPEIEVETVAFPLTVALAEKNAPHVLDVAAGTGRVARGLYGQIAFDGTVVSADLSLKMLRAGQAAANIPIAPATDKLAALLPAGFTLETVTSSSLTKAMRAVQCPADRLPFPDNSFDCVTCLEALEFFPSTQAALAELVRVLKPGGVLLTTNRVGWQARLMVGKTFTRPAFAQLLTHYPLTQVRIEPWQVEYDLVWAHKRQPLTPPR